MYDAQTLLVLEHLLDARTFSALYERADHPAVDLKPSMRLSTEHLPEEVKHVARSINSAGGKAMIVGGAVRDSLRQHFGHSNQRPKDYDLEVHGMQPEHLHGHLNTLGKTKTVGEKSFGVNKLRLGGHEFDVSIPAHASFEHGTHGEVDPKLPVSKAGLRRDFTMNSVAMDPLTGHVYDPHSGIHDIKHKILRHSTDTAFEEANGNGPIRIMRGAQFAARQGLKVHPETMSLMQKASHRLATKEVAPERIHAEWNKLVTKGSHPSRGLHVLKHSGALRHLHPELDASHDEDWEHTKQAMDHVHGATHSHDAKEAIRYATLLHKTHAGKKAEHVADYAYKHFGVKKNVATQVGKLVEHGHRVNELHDQKDKITPGHIRRLAHDLGPASIDQLVHVAHGHHAARSEDPHHAGEWLRDAARAHGVHDAPEQAMLTGAHLKAMGVKPGRHYSQIMQHVHDLQLKGDVRSEKAALDHARQYALAHGHLSEGCSFYSRIFT